MGEISDIRSKPRPIPIYLERGKEKVKHICYGISPYCSNAMLSSNPHSGIYKADTTRTLDLNGGSPACNQGGIIIIEIYNA